MALVDASGNQNNLTRTGGTISRSTYGGNRSVLVDETVIANSTMLIIDDEEYQLFSYQALKLNDNFSYQAILKKAEKTDVPENAS